MVAPRAPSRDVGIVYEPEAAVHHSHAYSVASAMRRFFDSGRLGRALLRRTDRAVGRGAAQGRRALRAGRAPWLWTTGQRRWIPYTAVYELAKFAGLQLGRRHRLLPTAVKTRLSGYPNYWR